MRARPPVVLLVIAVYAASAAGPASATFPGRNGLIAFDTGDAPRSQIYTVAPSGRHLKQLTHGKAGQRSDPHWARDASRIAYVSDESGNPQIWIMRRDGSGQHALTHDKAADYFAPSWSPSGRRILASRCNHLLRTCDIVTVSSRTGKGRRTLVSGNWHHGQPAYAPDGKRIAYTSDQGGFDSRLWLAAADGSHRRHISPAALVADRVNWAPSGDLLTFTGDPALGAVFSIRASGGEAHRLHQSPETLFASYSPKGREIVENALEKRCGCHSLFVARADGTHQRALTRTRLEGVRLSDWGVRFSDWRMP